MTALIDVLNTELSVRAYNCLARAGITDLKQLSNWTCDDLRKVRNLGRKHFQEIIDICHKNEIYLKDELSYDDGQGLLPCPFCGRENVFISKLSMSGVYRIRCADCQTVFGMDCTAGHDYDKQRLKDMWNRRAKV